MERAVKEIGVALSSSVDEFREERLELGNFIRFLNDNIYKQRKIHLDWYVCEDESGAITHERRQEVFNTKIAQTRFFFMLIGRHIGKYTREEFDVALALFNASRDRPEPKARDIPKIFPYFKEMPHEERTTEAQAFRAYLHSDVNGGQYSLKYNHLDTLKLRMLTEFGRDIVLGGKLTVEDETAQIDGQPVTAINVGKIPAYANHRNLKRLRRQKANLDAEFAELSLRYHAGDADAGQERLLVSQERNELSRKIHAIEGAVLDTFNLVTEMMREHQTERTKVAARLLEAGKYEQARAILQSVDSPEIRADWERAEQMLVEGREAIRELIQENRLRIRVLRAHGVDKETLTELEACYKQSAHKAQQYRIELDAVYDYARFLEEQADYLHAIDLCEWLETEYQQTDTPPKTWMALWNLLGLCHFDNENFQKAETYLRKALKNCRVLAGTNPAEFAVDVATTCTNLANLLQNTGEYREAEELYREALERYCALAETRPATFIRYVAAIQNNLAVLLRSIKKYDEAEALYREALKHYRALAETSPAAFTQYVAYTCSNLAKLLRDTGECEKAKALYWEALEIRRALDKAYPGKFTLDVANAYFNLGVFEWCDQFNLDAAKKFFQEAASIYECFPNCVHMTLKTRMFLEILEGIV